MLAPPMTEQATPTEPVTEHSFQAEVREVLNLVIHSLYTNSEVFLRELLSNASDALDKARFLALTRTDVTVAEGEPKIRLRLDEEARTLTVEDDGVGMTRDEVVQNLGTIARSGSADFLKRMREEAKDQAGALKLIGQFGVGFYSAFMVASRVDVSTKSMLPGAEPVLWRSTGAGSFTVGPGERERPGTTIVLHLKDEHRELAKAWRVREIVKKYSDFVPFPIVLGDDEVLNQSRALWTLPKSQIDEAQHRELFHHLGGAPDDAPLLTVHLSVDAPVQFHALLYVPGKAPADLFTRDVGRGPRLYAKRVLVMEHCEKLVPQWLRFLRGVVDSEDLSLNVSREMLQESRALGQIETQLVKQVLRSLRELADGDRAKYERVFELFGKVLKEGIATELRHRDALAELCLFETVQTPAGDGPFPKRISLAEYVSAARDDQPIYYLTGSTRHSMEASPHLEAFKKRGLDVLLLSDPIDEWVVQSLPAFQKRPLKSVSHGELDLGDAGDAPEAPAAAADAAVAAVKRALAGKVRDVRLSKRLTDSASCLVAEEGALGSNMERMLRMLDESTPQASRVLELNGAHPIVKNLGALAEREPESPALVEWSETLYEQALLAEGIVEDPVKLLKRLESLLTKVSERA
jgi:molecular chaperone HtpG